MKWVEVEETVRFNEVDEWGMAWYGHYMAWFEVGRMSLLRQFDLLPGQMEGIGSMGILIFGIIAFVLIIIGAIL